MSKYLKKHSLALWSSVVLTAIIVAVTLLQPKLLSTVINKGINNVDANGVPHPDLALVDQYGTWLIILAIIGLVAGVINTVISAKVSQSIGAEIRDDLFKKIQSFSYNDIENFNASNLVVRMTNDVNQIQMLILMTLQQMLRIPLLFIGAFILAMVVLPGLWWIIVVEILLVVVILGFINGSTFPMFGKYQKKIDAINARVKDNFIGSRVVKSFVQEDHEIKEFAKQSDELAKLTFGIGRNFSITMPMLMLIGNMGVVAAIYFSSDNVVADMSMLGDLVSYINYLFTIMFALIIGGFMMMIGGRAATSIKRINEILKYDPAFKYTNTHDVSLYNDIEFNNVSYHFPNDDNNVLENITFKVKKGETIGIVGATGSGKSTLINLMARLFDPTEGEILIGGVPLTHVNKDRLRSELSIILQKPYLFSGTINSNIRDGKLNASDQEVYESVKIAQAYEFIETLEEAYEAEVQQRGTNFSGGQKQRLSIARGLVKKPSILILDDSTSALDSKSEQLVKKGLEEQYSETTKFIVSQKISSVVHADQIIVLDEGCVVGIGTHKELVQSSEIYREIFESQKGRD